MAVIGSRAEEGAAWNEMLRAETHATSFCLITLLPSQRAHTTSFENSSVQDLVGVGIENRFLFRTGAESTDSLESLASLLNDSAYRFWSQARRQLENNQGSTKCGEGALLAVFFFNPHATDIKLFRYFYHVYIM